MESEGWSNVFILLWCSRLHRAFRFWLPADLGILEIYRTMHFDYFPHSDSSNYCWCFVRNKTVWLREGQNQANKSYNFNSQNVYKYSQKRLSHSFICPWHLKVNSGFDTFRCGETCWKCLYRDHTHTHTHKAETNTHKHSSTHTHARARTHTRTHERARVCSKTSSIHSHTFTHSVFPSLLS